MARKRSTRSRNVSRRRLLQGVGAGIGTAALGCTATESTDVTQHNAAGVGGAGGGYGTGGGTSSATSTTGTGGTGSDAGSGGGGGAIAPSCTDSAGLSPEELLAKIDTWVVLCMENRSFDHFLGSLQLKEGKDVVGL